MTKYSIDTSGLLRFWRRSYPPENFPSLWTKLDALIDQGRLIATEEVLVELSKQDDEVHRWARKRRSMFVPLDDAIQVAVRSLLEEHSRLLDTRKNRSGADPFVIGLAMLEDCPVITDESYSKSPTKRPHIPDVCVAVGVPVMTALDLIKAEKWKL